METIFTGIDIGSAEIRAIVCSRNKKTKKIKILKKISIPSLGVKNGIIENYKLVSEQIKKIIKKVEEDLGIKISEALFALEPHSISIENISVSHTTTTVDKKITENDLLIMDQKALKKFRVEGFEYLDFFPTEYILDGEEKYTKPKDLYARTILANYVFVKIPKNSIENLERVAEISELDVLGISSSSLCSSLMTLSPEDRKSGCVLLDFGHNTTSMIVYKNDSPIFFENIKLGLSEVTKNIALHFKIEQQEAEKLKRNVSFADEKKQIEKIYQDFFKKVSKEVLDNLKEIEMTKKVSGGIIILAPFYKNEVFTEMLKKLTKLPVKISKRNLFSETGSGFTGAYCLALNSLNLKQKKMFNVKQIKNNFYRIFKNFFI